MQFQFPRAGDPVPPEYVRLLDNIDKLAESLDRRFCIPFTKIRFGWDPVIGLVPVAGDLVATAFAIRIVLAARRLGADAGLLRRMSVIVAIDALIGLVPIIGSAFDVIYRANVRNVDLLMTEIGRHRRS